MGRIRCRRDEMTRPSFPPLRYCTYPRLPALPSLLCHTDSHFGITSTSGLHSSIHPHTRALCQQSYDVLHLILLHIHIRQLPLRQLQIVLAQTRYMGGLRRPFDQELVFLRIDGGCTATSWVMWISICPFSVRAGLPQAAVRACRRDLPLRTRCELGLR